MSNNNTMNRAYGCMLGLMCGDAAGATLEFYKKTLTEKKVKKAMNMPGGGQLQVGKGQFTDDTELAFSLAFALYDKNPINGFPLNDVASQYQKWFLSRPFDMGGTCARAFSIKHSKHSKGDIADAMMQQACESVVSEANGSLMRIAPVAIWCATQQDHVIAKNAKLDAMLSHPSQVCQECNAVYCVAISYLIKRPGNYIGAISHLDDFVTNHVYEPKVKKWYFEESLDIKTLDCTKNIGHVKWGFVLAMHFLRKNESYEQSIYETLMKGGDTDTNAAIVGALIGTLHGVDDIPHYMKDPVLKFDVSSPQDGYARPEMYKATNMHNLVYRLVTHNDV